MINVADPRLQQILAEMDVALADEIKEQSSRRSADHTAIDGQLSAEASGHYVYSFTLKDLWEPEDDTPIRIKVSDAPSVKATIVNSNGTTITIATEEALAPEALRKIEIISDATELLERLRDALKNNNEGEAQLGSKSFGLQTYSQGRRPSPVTFGNFPPDESQDQASRMALVSEVTYIIGPPGTGKTFTLAAIALAHLREGRTVLIAAHTNIAVDNAIMKLADICQEAGATVELQNGQIIRFGTPQHKSLITNDKYENVYLPKIIKRRGSDLHQQRDALQTSLNQILNNLAAKDQREQLIKNSWQTQHLTLSKQRDASQKELNQLQEQERQRIAPLISQLRHVTEQLQQAQRDAYITHRQLSQLSAQQVQYEIARTNHLEEVNKLFYQLAEVQQMSPIKIFFKRIDPKRIESALADAKQQVWQDEQILAGLQKNLHTAHAAYSVAQKQVEQLNASYNEALAQRNRLSPFADRITYLSRVIEQFNQQIAEGNSRLQRELADMQQQQKAQQGDVERIREQIAAIDKQIKNLEKSVVAEACVIATTLSKTYMNQSLSERRFDVVILDEVSMAPLPAVYIAASHADRSVVAIGDPHQLAPIVMANTPVAKKWLGTDLFEFRGISLKRAVEEGYGNSVLLNEQSRMHPGISVIARKHVYKGRITNKMDRLNTDERKAYEKVEPSDGKSLLLCDTSDVNPITTKLDRGRINIYHALCSVAIARKVLASLPELDAYQNDIQRIGLVTPYHKQADLLNQLIREAGLKDFVRAGTIHRFQGLEFDVVIFDTVDSIPCTPIDFTAGGWGTGAMRLVNVAVTRPKHKLIIIANADYIQRKFAKDSILQLAVKEAREASTIKSYEVLDLKLPPLSETIRNLLKNHDPEVLRRVNSSGSSKYELTILNEDTFFVPFQTDLQRATKQIIIFSPFLTPYRTKQISRVLSDRLQAGVQVTVITKPVDKSNDAALKAEPLLREIKVELRNLPDMHEKLVLIDEEIVYIGSLNALSHRDSTEIMLRIKSQELAKEIWKMTNRKSVEKRDDNTLVKAPQLMGDTIEISLQALPQIVCEICGGVMLAKPPKYGPFYYRCSSCGKNARALVSHINENPLLTKVICDKCNNLMIAKIHNDEALLECSATTSCGYRRRITFTT